jgi:hypothetical protein
VVFLVAPHSGRKPQYFAALVFEPFIAVPLRRPRDPFDLSGSLSDQSALLHCIVFLLVKILIILNVFHCTGTTIDTDT